MIYSLRYVLLLLLLTAVLQTQILFSSLKFAAVCLLQDFKPFPKSCDKFKPMQLTCPFKTKNEKVFNYLCQKQNRCLKKKSQNDLKCLFGDDHHRRRGKLPTEWDVWGPSGQ